MISNPHVEGMSDALAFALSTIPVIVLLALVMVAWFEQRKRGVQHIGRPRSAALRRERRSERAA